MQKRYEHLDVLRLLAVILVMFGHYVSVGGGAKVIPLIIADDFPLPLFDATKWHLWKFEIFLIEQFSTQTAILGVSIFFLITGYLMPVMMERYSRIGFLVNRFFRIFPVLIVATIIIAIFVRITQGISFNLSSFVSSWTLTYFFIGLIPITGVLWTLTVEVLFYLISSVIGKFTIVKLYFTQIFLLGIILLSLKFNSSNGLNLMAMQAKYLLMICLGSAIFLAEKEDLIINKICLIGSSIVLSYLGFQLYKLSHEDVSTYNNIGTHLLALGLFAAFQILSKLDLLKYLPSLLMKLSDLVYPIYLLHATIGLGVIAIMRKYTSEPYFLLLFAVVTSIFASWVLHIAVEKPSIKFGRNFTSKRSIGT